MTQIIASPATKRGYFRGFQGISSCDIGRFEGLSMGMTKHAGIRVQQRGVNRDVLDCLLAYGRHEPDHKGCRIVTFDGKSLNDLARHEPRALKTKAIDSRNVYAVADSEGVVITAGHRFRRVPRDLSLSSLRPGRSRSLRVVNAPCALS
jgi:hypothetical protein